MKKEIKKEIKGVCLLFANDCSQCRASIDTRDLNIDRDKQGAHANKENMYVIAGEVYCKPCFRSFIITACDIFRG